MVVREYLVENFGFDDSQLKTLGMGKQAGSATDADWGSIQILIYPAGTDVHADKNAPGAIAPVADVSKPAQVIQ